MGGEGEENDLLENLREKNAWASDEDSEGLGRK